MAPQAATKTETVALNRYGPSKRMLRQTWPDGTEIRFSYKVVGGCVPGIISIGGSSGDGAKIIVGSELSSVFPVMNDRFR